MFTNETISKIILIAFGSALGGNARYWIGSWVQRRVETLFPIGTFVVNISGAFLLGFIVSFIAESIEVLPSAAIRLFFVIGFLGSYTTFSALEYETLDLMESGSFFMAFLNLFGSLVAGFVAVWMGKALGRV